jgi:hypothetical protein
VKQAVLNFKTLNDRGAERSCYHLLPLWFSRADSIEVRNWEQSLVT